MKTVILMSTYNGKKFLPQQLESLCKQKNVNDLMLFVRDDGSSDNTKEILKQYENELNIQYYSNKVKYGAAMSFWMLMLNAPVADYYCFSDQDDVWDEEKILYSIKTIQRTEKKKGGKPILFCCESRMIDAASNVISEGNNGFPDVNVRTQFISGDIPGCAMTFNYSALELIRKKNIKFILMHDLVLMLYMLSEGVVIYDNKKLFSRRVHEKNAVACMGKSRYKRSFDAIKRWRANKGLISKMAEEYLNNENDKLDEKTIEFLKLIINSKYNISCKLRLAQIIKKEYNNNKNAKRSFLIRMMLGMI